MFMIYDKKILHLQIKFRCRKFSNKIGIYFSFDKELNQIKIIINTFYILLDRFNLTIIEIMSHEGYDYDGKKYKKSQEKMLFKNFTNTDIRSFRSFSKVVFILEFVDVVTVLGLNMAVDNNFPLQISYCCPI